MKGKIAFVVGAAVGYVVGTRAGREQFEKIKAGAERLWDSQAVQDRVGAVGQTVSDAMRDQSASVVDKLADLAKERLGVVPPKDADAA